MKAYKKGEMQDYIQPKQKPKGPKKKTSPAKPEGKRLPQVSQADTPGSRRVNTSLPPKEGERKHSLQISLVPLLTRTPKECFQPPRWLRGKALAYGSPVCRYESRPSIPSNTIPNDVTGPTALNAKTGSRKTHCSRVNTGSSGFILSPIRKPSGTGCGRERTSERRTRVIDDNCDYYSSDNKWLTPEQREVVRRKEAELKAEQEASKRRHKVTLDFAGRQVLSSQEEEASMQSLIQRFMAPLVEGGVNDRVCREVEATHFIDPALDMPAPEYVDTGGLRAPRRNRPGGDGSLVNTTGDGIVLGSRIQDRGLMEMSDDGFALSVHQPYASLLVAGIKKHEGRSWYTTYRGRLWIHAAAKPPTSEDISTVVGIFQKITQGQSVRFPEQYPTGCLLGCVNLIDCLPQDTYREQYPFGECFSPYVYICEEPQELQVKFPMKGKHKIFKIDSRLHQASKKTLLCPQILA
ncbi:unnamed protein product [Ixodes hexagonus]